VIASLRPVLARLRVPTPPTGLLRNVVPLVVLSAAVTALVLMLLWRDQAAYKPVFGAAEKIAAAEMMSVLDAEGVPYRLHPDSGQVLVPEDRLGRVRMLLAAKGVVAQLPAGLELMDRSDPLGVSQFVQDVRFRRGLEGELAQSIATLDAVASARVHLSIAKSSSFVVSDGSKSSASVVVTLKPGRELGAEQVAAVIKMVSGAVASLDPQRVSLVDQTGKLLSAQVDLTEGFDPLRGGEVERRYRDETRANVRALLAPVLGEHNYQVSVSVAVDNDRTQETHERYGETPKVTSEAMREESGRDPLAIGVPGSLSNRPVNTPQATDGKEASTAQRAATTRQYAYDRSVTQVERGRGRLTKLSVAVIVNSAAAPGGGGQWTPDALADIERVLAGGLGIDVARGDSLVVSVMKFPDVPTPLSWWEERDVVVDAGGYAASAVGLLLAYLLVVRPLLRIAQRRWAPALPERDITDEFEPVVAIAETRPAGALGGPTSGGAADNSVVPLLENYDLPPAGSPVDVLVDHLRVLAAKEPERVAEVVKQWVQGNGRS